MQIHALRCAFYSQIPGISVYIRSTSSALGRMYAECNVVPSYQRSLFHLQPFQQEASSLPGK